MTADTLTLADFILARIGEDESDVNTRGTHAVGHRGHCIFEGGYEGTNACDCNAIARVLAQCKAHRAIVAEHALTDYQGVPSCWLCAPEYSWGKEPDEGPCLTLCALAAIWSDHKDWREEWSALVR